MTDTILVLNAGSSSIKFALFPAADEPTRRDVVCKGSCDGIGHAIHFSARDRAGAALADEQWPQGETHEDALAGILRWVPRRLPDHRLIAAGHRVVHGGTRYKGPVRIDADVVAELSRLVPLAPLHQPHHLAAIAALARLHPSLPQVACFDTSFHHTQADVATAFALPRRLRDEGVRRYGFHGLSYEYIASVLPTVVGSALAEGRVIVAHLGSGASMCGLEQRRSVATTMGFTALDGLPMSRRCGNLDPGVVLYLMQEKGLSAQAISELLYQDSGLYGVSGISDDMRTLLATQDSHAAEAIDVFVYRVGRELGSLASALGGVDALVFTAGIGEHAAEIRRRVLNDAAWLGFVVDEASNDANRPLITVKNARASGWVIPTDEDLMIARHTRNLLVNDAIRRKGSR